MNLSILFLRYHGRRLIAPSRPDECLEGLCGCVFKALARDLFKIVE